MYRLDRIKDSGRITKAFLPARDLYKYDPVRTQESKKDQAVNNTTSSGASQTATDIIPNHECLPKSPVFFPTDQDVELHPREDLISTKKPKQQRRVPPAPGQAATYHIPDPPHNFSTHLPFLFADQETSSFEPQLAENGDSSDVFYSPRSQQSAGQSPQSAQQSQQSPEGSPESDTRSSVQAQETDQGSGDNIQTGQPIKRQRSGSYPPPKRRPGNTNDWSRRDHSVLRNIGSENPGAAELNVRPQRERKPPKLLTYNEKGQQQIVRSKRTDL